MSKRDEEIVARKRAIQIERAEQKEKETIEAEKAESIFDGRIHIDEKEVNFVRREIGEYGFSLLLPETFTEMAQEDKDAIYPYGKAPYHVYAGEDAPFQVSVNKTEHIVPNSGIPKFMGIAKNVMEKIGPQARILSNYHISRGERNIGLMEIATMGLDGAVYNMQFYLSMSDQKIVIGAITCQAKRHDRMLPIMKEIVDSIIIFEDKEK